MPNSDGTKTALERLVQYEAAETAIIGGAQSYSVGGMTFNRASLGTLRSMIAEARREYLATTGGRVLAARVDLSGAF